MSSYAPWLPQTPNERRMVAVAILALLGLFAADAVAAPGHARMAVLAMVLALPPLLVVHELGHGCRGRGRVSAWPVGC